MGIFDTSAASARRQLKAFLVLYAILDVGFIILLTHRALYPPAHPSESMLMAILKASLFGLFLPIATLSNLYKRGYGKPAASLDVTPR